MLDFNIDVAALVVGGVGAAYLVGSLRQRVASLEQRLSVSEIRNTHENALLLDIRERVITIEHCINYGREPKLPRPIVPPNCPIVPPEIS